MDHNGICLQLLHGKLEWRKGREKALVHENAISSEALERWPAGNPWYMTDQAGMLQQQKVFALGLSKKVRKDTIISCQEISPGVNMVIRRTTEFCS